MEEEDFEEQGEEEEEELDETLEVDEELTPEPTNIPKISDALHSKMQPTPGKLHDTPSAAAVRGRLRRLMQPSQYGTFKVSNEVLQDFRKGGSSRTQIEQIFQMVGYCKDRGCQSFQSKATCTKSNQSVVCSGTRVAAKPITHPQETFLQEVELIRSELQSAEVEVTGQFVSKQAMIDWGWSARCGSSSFA